MQSLLLLNGSFPIWAFYIYHLVEGANDLSDHLANLNHVKKFALNRSITLHRTIKKFSITRPKIPDAVVQKIVKIFCTPKIFLTFFWTLDSFGQFRSFKSLSRRSIEMECIECSSYNTFYPFQNKHQIHRHLQSVKMLCAHRLVQTECLIRSRIVQFNARVKHTQIENSLSYCVNACDLRRSEQAICKNQNIVKVMKCARQTSDHRRL